MRPSETNYPGGARSSAGAGEAARGRRQPEMKRHPRRSETSGPDRRLDRPIVSRRDFRANARNAARTQRGYMFPPGWCWASFARAAVRRAIPLAPSPARSSLSNPNRREGPNDSQHSAIRTTLTTAAKARPHVPNDKLRRNRSSSGPGWRTDLRAASHGNYRCEAISR